jgi:hypothetical protein
MVNPIYVPSRGRTKAATLQTFAVEGIAASVFVPPDEAQDYADEYSGSSVVVYESPEQKDGIGAVRNAMLADARDRKSPNIWMIDDDIVQTYVDHHKASFTDAIERLEEELNHWPTVRIGGPMLEVWGKRSLLLPPDMAERRAFVRNASIFSFFLIDTTGPWSFWDTYLEDVDVLMQILLEGYHSVKVRDVGFAASPGGMGATDGGCADGYRSGEGTRASERLEEKWDGLLIAKSKIYPNGTKSYRPRRSVFSMPERTA